jgi:hypothetical protein
MQYSCCHLPRVSSLDGNDVLSKGFARLYCCSSLMSSARGLRGLIVALACDKCRSVWTITVGCAFFLFTDPWPKIVQEAMTLLLLCDKCSIVLHWWGTWSNMLGSVGKG